MDRRIIITTLRDIVNLVIFNCVFIAAIYYAYNVTPELAGIKNVLFPMNVAILLGVLLSILFIFVNRLTTYLALKIMEGR